MLYGFEDETESEKISKVAICKGFLSRKIDGSADTNKRN
jgi:hypothetical protein